MLRTNFSRMFKLRNIERPFRFLLKNGISRNIAERIAEDSYYKIDPVILERLCVLLHCTPNELLQWTPNSPIEDTPEHPLAALKPKQVNVRVLEMMGKIPLHKLDELEKAIEQLKNS
jgi:DNA-binding Xre family transcriptional regulator